MPELLSELSTCCPSRISTAQRRAVAMDEWSLAGQAKGSFGSFASFLLRSGTDLTSGSLRKQTLEFNTLAPRVRNAGHPLHPARGV